MNEYKNSCKNQRKKHAIQLRKTWRQILKEYKEKDYYDWHFICNSSNTFCNWWNGCGGESYKLRGLIKEAAKTFLKENENDNFLKKIEVEVQDYKFCLFRLKKQKCIYFKIGRFEYVRLKFLQWMARKGFKLIAI